MIWYYFNFVFHYKCLTWELEGGSFGFSRHDIVGRLVFCTSLQCVNSKPILPGARGGRPENCFYTSKFKRGSPLKTRPSYFIRAAARSLAIFTLVMSLLAFALIRSKVWFCRFRAVFMSFDMFLMLPIMALTWNWDFYCDIILKILWMKTHEKEC